MLVVAGEIISKEVRTLFRLAFSFHRLLLIAKTTVVVQGNAYEIKKGDVEWQKIAYKKDAGAAVTPNAAVKAAA